MDVLVEALQLLVLLIEVAPRLHMIYHLQTHMTVVWDQLEYLVLFEKGPRPHCAARTSDLDQLAAEC